MNKEFLLKLYEILKDKNIIKENPNNRAEKITLVESYLEKLDRINNRVQGYENVVKYLKELYYERYVINPSDIPDSYWKHLEKGYLDEGAGHINLVNPKSTYDKEIKEEHIKRITDAQKESIDSWLDYLMSSDSSYMPTWGKVWVFLGMLKIGTYNKETGNFNRRRKDTVDPYINFDSEIVNKAIELKKAYEDYSFKKIYEILTLNKAETKLNGNEGIWIKYSHGSKSDAEKLYESLQGYNTGWCTAASINIATEQVCGGKGYVGGNFYVYYTKNELNEYKIPRIAIRMDENKIGEIRGVAESQNLELEMEEILDKKLDEFPDKYLYQKRVNDMKMLTQIYDKKDKELTKEELEFLYEIKKKISKFGYQDDPRITEIKRKRFEFEDYATIFSCSNQEITDLLSYFYRHTDKVKVFLGSISDENLLTDKLIYVLGSIDIRSIIEEEFLRLPTYVGGSVYLVFDSLTKSNNLTFPKYVLWDLTLYNLITVEEVNFSDYVGRNLVLPNLKIAKNTIFSKFVGGTLHLRSLEIHENMTLPEHVEGFVFLDSLKSTNGLILPKYIGAGLVIGLIIKDLIDCILPEVCRGKILLLDFEGTLEELKEKIDKLKTETLSLTKTR